MKDRMNELLLSRANWQSILVEAFDQTVMISSKVKSKQHAATVIVTAIVMNAVADFKMSRRHRRGDSQARTSTRRCLRCVSSLDHCGRPSQ